MVQIHVLHRISIVALTAGLLCSFASVSSVFAQRGDQPQTTERQRSASSETEPDRRPREGRGAERGDASSEARGPRMRRLSLEQLDDAIEIVVRIQPDLEPTLREHRDQHPERILAMIEQRFPRLGFMLELKERQPELFALRVEELRLTIQIQKVAQQYRRAKHAENEQVMADSRVEIEALVQERFALSQALRQERIAAMERYIAQMRTQQEAEAADKEKHIQEQVEQALSSPPSERSAGEGRGRR